MEQTDSTHDFSDNIGQPIVMEIQLVEGVKNREQKTPLIARYYTKPGGNPFNSVTWEFRTAAITNDRGESIFEQKKVEFPKSWSQMATNVVASKYFQGEIGSVEREFSIKQLIARIVGQITSWGLKDHYFRDPQEAKIFEDELTYILLNQFASFNSPVWFNVGVHERPQCSACFILSVEDTMDSLLELQAVEGKLFKWGSGTGSNLSKIRSSKEKLSGGGRPSGPVSFMKGFDAWASIIKSGGKTRRAAKMQILNVDHPDILEFIKCKCEEEKKAKALIEHGYDGGFAVNGGAYDSVSFQNANLSVRVSNNFMQSAVNDRIYSTKMVKSGQDCEELNAGAVLKQIAEATYLCGDPGIQFDDTINDWHTCPNSGRINASNPCSEYMHLDDSACNLSSLNLLKFLKDDGKFDYDSFRHVASIMIIAQDILIDNSSYPTKKIENNARNFRQLGLGYANLGALLMNLGLPYDSEAGRSLAAAITSVMTAQAYLTSSRLADTVGQFAGYKKNKAAMLRVIKKHRDATKTLFNDTHSDEGTTAVKLWDEVLESGVRCGFRNSQTTVLAPTGTISFMMDCDTTGIEPDIALVKYKKLVGGGYLKLINASVVKGLERLGYSTDQILAISDYIDKHDTIEGAPEIKDEDLAVFDCALKPTNGSRFIGYKGHLKMMAAIQPFISGAISKTVNLPTEATIDQIYNIYVEAWQQGLKAVALYRDGSKQTQPLNTKKVDTQESKTFKPDRRRLPDVRQAITHKFAISGLKGYLTVGLFEDGSPGEVFLVVAKEGSTLSGIMDAFATTVSLALQYGVPLEALVKKFTYVRFEPSGFTGNKEIPSAQSIVDYVFRWLALRFLTPQQLSEMGLKNLNGAQQAQIQQLSTPLYSDSNGDKISESNHGVVSANGAAFQICEDAPPCTNCGSGLMIRQAGCYVCLNCGTQGGCG